MSSILKAIRKAEDDNRADAGSAPDLMVDHGISQSQSSLRPSLVYGVLAGVTVFIIASFCLYYFTSIPLTKASDPVVATNTSGPDNVQVPQQEVTSSVVGSQTLPADLPAKSDEYVQSNQSSIGAKQLTLPVFNSKMHAAVDSRLPQPPPLPKLVVTEIFYQDDNSTSMAVVNDLPVMIGTRAESVTVKGIHPDHVVFSFNDNDYIVPLTPVD